MSVQQTLEQRSNSTCEMCKATDNLSVYKLPPALNESVDEAVLVCNNCLEQMEDSDKMDANHWRCRIEKWHPS